MRTLYFYQTDLGEIGIAENGSAIINLYFPAENIPQDAVLQETELLKEAAAQLKEYFSGKRKNFSLRLAPAGTDFMLRVWEALHQIPYGETRSYKNIAESIGRPKASRAVGMANNKNTLPIFIPCHRVIGADGKLVGYRGGLEIKEHLWELERQHVIPI